MAGVRRIRYNKDMLSKMEESIMELLQVQHVGKVYNTRLGGQQCTALSDIILSQTGNTLPLWARPVRERPRCSI